MPETARDDDRLARAERDRDRATTVAAEAIRMLDSGQRILLRRRLACSASAADEVDTSLLTG
jgi:hypothetical protein